MYLKLILKINDDTYTFEIDSIPKRMAKCWIDAVCEGFKKKIERE